MNDISLDAVPVARFLELVRTPFEVRDASAAVVTLELLEVSRPRSGGPADAESFSLLFEGPATQPLGQGTFTFSHPGLGRFALFIVPVSAERGARQYEAVFNRRREAR